MHILLCEGRLRWLDPVHRRNDDRIPKTVELTMGFRPVSHPRLCFKDVGWGNLRVTGRWEQLDDRSSWQHFVHVGVTKDEKKRNKLLEIRRQWREQRRQSQIFTSHSSFVCHTCKRDCHAKIWLLGLSQVLLTKVRILSKECATIISRDKWLPITIYINQQHILSVRPCVWNSSNSEISWSK